MRIWLIVIVMLLNVNQANATVAVYIESDITLAKGIVASSCRPANSNKSPAVLMLHGFASSKDEVGDLYKRLAIELCKAGIGSLRLAYRGWGESAGRMQDITLHTEISDIEIAKQYLMQQDWVDTERIGLLGFSMGGGLAMITTKEHPALFKSLVTWSSAGDFKQDFLAILGQETFDRAKQQGEITIDLGWRKVTLGAGFFDSLNDFDLAECIANYQGAYLAIAGSFDFSAAYTSDYVALAKGTPKQAHIIPGADHIFSVLTADQSTAQHVIAKTRQWFTQTL